MLDRNAKWIWIAPEAKRNEYARFEGGFSFFGGEARFFVAAETDYVLHINGRLAGFGQFAGYPFEKYYDALDISALCAEGQNRFSLTVRYEGVNSATHIDDGAGVIFSLAVNGVTQVRSGEDTLGALEHRYLQHTERAIASQLGLTAGMTHRVAPSALQPCFVIDRTCEIKTRPVKKTVTGEPAVAHRLEGARRIYDLGREEAGYLFWKVRAGEACDVKVTYAEHLSDGGVRYLIGRRDFSLDFQCVSGEQEFLQLFVRVAARYLEVLAPDDLEVLSVGLLPTLYPVTERTVTLEGLDRQIYDTCVRTLRLCMNQHYEDCPWREQALYVMDSRNQMLCGYDAFEGAAFQRANLVLISKGLREDGLLELTYPAVNTPAIPFFSLMYPVAVSEYIQHTSDRSILSETMGAMRRIMEHLRDRLGENGLLCELEAPYWNFYEWSEGSDGAIREAREHLILNCAFVYAARAFRELCELVGEAYPVDLERTCRAITECFFQSETGLFSLRAGGRECSQLGNAFALLIGLGDGRTVKALQTCSGLIPATLSMLPFVYDALLLHDANAREFVLADIRQKYGSMLDRGATSFWETLEGAPAFGNAGSLCHGWSVMPIHYYHRFFKI